MSKTRKVVLTVTLTAISLLITAGVGSAFMLYLQGNAAQKTVECLNGTGPCPDGVSAQPQPPATEAVPTNPQDNDQPGDQPASDQPSGWAERQAKYNPGRGDPQNVTWDNSIVADIFLRNLVHAKRDPNWFWSIVKNPRSEVGKYLAKTEIVGTTMVMGEDYQVLAGQGTGPDRTLQMHLLTSDTVAKSPLATLHFAYEDGHFLLEGIHVDATDKTYGDM
jgi:hypothetical protein